MKHIRCKIKCVYPSCFKFKAINHLCPSGTVSSNTVSATIRKSVRLKAGRLDLPLFGNCLEKYYTLILISCVPFKKNSSLLHGEE